MDRLLNRISQKHQEALNSAFPPTKQVCTFANDLLDWMFPEHNGAVIASREKLEHYLLNLRTQLEEILQGMQKQLNEQPEKLAKDFLEQLPDIYDDLTEDAQAIYAGDPASTSLYEVIRTYPGFYAIAFYRMAHALHRLDIPLLPRMITEFAHTRTGIDIHPAARIASHFCIDHGTGVVIGETTVIGRYVKLYQGVTLGALSVRKSLAKSQRHPTIEDHVIIYSGATILGGETVVGHHSVIGGNVWLVESVPPRSKIYYKQDNGKNG